MLQTRPGRRGKQQNAPNLGTTFQPSPVHFESQGWLHVNKQEAEINVTEYHRIGHCNLVPAHYSEKELELIHELNRRVIKALKIKWGMTHLEYYLTDEGILFGEVALRPPGGHIMDCMSIAYDVNIWDHFIDVELLQKTLVLC